MQNIKFDLNDITLVPETLSTIDSRSLVETKYGIGKLPLIVSPMDTVINNDNVSVFSNNLLTCSVRTTGYLQSQLYDFIGLSLQQFEGMTLGQCDDYVFSSPGFLVDIASGNLLKLYNLVIKFKEKYPTIPLMIGNIANPETYRKYCEILTDIDMVRLGIGGGSACTTAANTAIHYPMGSLIKECFDISCKFNSAPKIVADGGFRNFDDIIKALNLGADYIMLGGILAKTIEACGDCYEKHPFGYTKVDNKAKSKLFEQGELFRKYRGMSTKDVQKSLGKDILTTSEGISKMVPVEYTLSGWIENFDAYLRSAMAYSDCLTLNQFIGKQNYIHITEQAIQRYKK